jgi:hypothetical protein
LTNEERGNNIFNMSKKDKESRLAVEEVNGYQQLKALYFFINPFQIKSFLSKHDYLYPILFEAKDKIYEIFGDDVTLLLELYCDIEEGWEELVIIIKSLYSAEEAQELDDRLADEWFLDKMDETKGKLNIIEEPL